MTVIHVDTDYIQDIGRKLVDAGNQLFDTSLALQRAIYRLDTWAWSGASRWRAEPLLSQTRPRCIQLADALDELGRKLAIIADAFEAQDQQAAVNIETLICWEQTIKAFATLPKDAP